MHSQPEEPAQKSNTLLQGLRISTIRTRLLVAFVLLVLLPAAVITLTSSLLGLQDARAKVINQLQSVATLKEAEILAWTQSLRSHLSVIIYPHQVPELVQPLMQHPASSAEYAAAEAGVRHLFDETMQRVDLFETLLLLDKQGQVRIATDRSQEGQSHVFQQYFWEGIRGETLQSLSSSTSQGSSPVVVARPLRDEAGEVWGVVAGRASPAILNEIMLQRAGLGITGETYLVGPSQLLLTELRFPNPDERVLRVRTEAVVTAITHHRNGDGLYENYRSVPVVGVYHWLPELRMVLIAEQSQAEALQATSTVFRVNVAIAATAVLLAIAAGLYVTRGIARPLANLADVATRIAGGDLDLHARIDSQDEIGALARAFNSMTDQLRYLIANLETRIGELHVAQAEARDARDAAEAANQAKSAFLANMSHELRTPLNAIIGYSEMLQEEATDMGDEELCSDLRKINIAANHLLDLISGVLDLSKIEAGKMDLQLETFQISEVVENVSTTARPLMEKNSNEFLINCPTDLGMMRADPLRVRQILFNLLSNAAKFTRQGRVTLTIWRENAGSDTNGGQQWVCFEVEDTGIGISAEQQAVLFQAFSQADSSTTRKYGGSGLGLVISRRFSQLMGGDITLESEAGAGSVFCVHLPVEVREPVLPAELPSLENPNAPTNAHPETVLRGA